MTTSTVSQANQRLVRRLLMVVVGMFGFGFAMVPLYNVFCELTGLNGKTRNEAVVATAGPVDTERTVTVEFLASLNEAAPWEFRPRVAKMKVHPGEFYQVNFFARNLTDQPLVGQAIPSVAPGLAAVHFQKIECFCFARQAFKPDEGRDMPVTFRLDPALPADIATVTLSYTFFKLDEVAQQN
jgi:cytochrome c oxidase assembly protein subunit 11